MKKIFFFFLVLVVANNSIIAHPSKPASHSEAFYLQKAKRLSTIGGILIGTGCIIGGAGVIIYPEGTYLFGGSTPEENRKIKTAEKLLGIGTLMALGSIPFFIMSGNNKRKARASAAVGFKMENIKLMGEKGFTSTSIPSISLKIPL